jgi:hypothetical protein
MTYLDKLPTELYNYIIWMSVGALDLDTYNKKKDTIIQLAHYKYVKNTGVQLDITYDRLCLYNITSYSKTPELEFQGEHYLYADRLPRSHLSGELWNNYLLNNQSYLPPNDKWPNHIDWTFNLL